MIEIENNFSFMQ